MTSGQLRVDIVGWPSNATAVRLRAELHGRGHLAAIVDQGLLAVEGGGEVDVAPYDVRVRPDVLVTAVSTEALVALDAIAALVRSGVQVVNPPEAVLASASKFTTARLLRAAGVPHPRTVQVSTAQAALTWATKLGWPVVVKALDGSEGNQVLLAADSEELVHALGAVRRSEGKDPTAGTPLLVQALVGEVGRDRRVVVCGGVAVAAIDRIARAGEWRSNLSQGAQPCGAVATALEASAAVAAVHSLGLDLGAVDVLSTDAGPVVLEVNSFGDIVDVAAFSGIDVIGAFADLVEAVAAGRRTLTKGSVRRLPPHSRAVELSFCQERLAEKAVELAALQRPADGPTPSGAAPGFVSRQR